MMWCFSGAATVKGLISAVILGPLIKHQLLAQLEPNEVYVLWSALHGFSCGLTAKQTSSNRPSEHEEGA